MIMKDEWRRTTLKAVVPILRYNSSISFRKKCRKHKTSRRIASHYIKIFGSVSDVLHGCAKTYTCRSRSEHKTSSGTSITSEVRKDVNVWVPCRISSKAVNLIHFHQCTAHSHERGDCLQMQLRIYCSREQPTKGA